MTVRVELAGERMPLPRSGERSYLRRKVVGSNTVPNQFAALRFSIRYVEEANHHLFPTLVPPVNDAIGIGIHEVSC